MLSTIVERACMYVPDVPVGVSNAKRSEGGVFRRKVPKEALTVSEKSFPIEALPRVDKVPVVVSGASDLVRFKRKLACLKLL